MTEEKLKASFDCDFESSRKRRVHGSEFLQEYFLDPPQSTTDGDWRHFDSRSILFWKEVFLLLSFSHTKRHAVYLFFWE